MRSSRNLSYETSRRDKLLVENRSKEDCRRAVGTECENPVFTCRTYGTMINRIPCFYQHLVPNGTKISFTVLRAQDGSS